MRKILLVVVAATAALAFTAVSASAASVEVGYFGWGGPGLGGAGSDDGQLDDPGAVDVRTSTGKVYVADMGNDRVQVFTPTFTGATYAAKVTVAAPTGIAVDQSSGDVYVSNASGVLKFDENLVPITGGWTAPTDTGTLAVDPGTGDLLLADLDDDLVRRYDSDGTAGATFAAARPIDLAVNSTGDVLVVTSTGDIVNDCLATSSIARFSSAGVLEGTLGALDIPGNVTVDPDDDSIVVAVHVNQWSCGSDSPSIAYFDAAGTPTSSVTLAAFPSTTWNVVPGLAAVGGGSSRVYAVTKSPANDGYSSTKVAVLERSNAPDVATDPVDAGSVSTTGATFSGTVDAHGMATQAHFEYRLVGTSAWASTPDRDAGSGTGPAPTGDVVVSDLRPNSHYEVRLVGDTGGWIGTSSTQAFTTAAAPPAAQTRPALGITPTKARLNGLVDPYGLATTYWVEYGTTTAYGARRPADHDADAGSGYGNVNAGQTVTGLQPATTYHFRVVAKNAQGTTPGEDRSFTTSVAPTTTADACPNAGIRAEQRATSLPDCGAYEMVSPPDKNGSDLLYYPSSLRTSPDGGTAAFTSTGGFAGSPGAPTAVQYIAKRGAGGWTTNGVSPRQQPNNAFGIVATTYRGFSEDLTRGYVTVYPEDAPTLVPGAPAGVVNLYSRTLPTGTFSVLSAMEPGLPAPSPGIFTPASFAAESADGSHVLFQSSLNLTANATGSSEKVYESVNGQVRLAGILPTDEGGGPAPGGSAAGIGSSTGFIRTTRTERAISRDGSRIFFTAPAGSAGQLYVRKNGTTSTRVSAPAAGAPVDGTRAARFWTATPDGRYVLFTSTQKLTGDSTAVSSNAADVYRYDVVTDELLDLSVSETGQSADVGPVSSSPTENVSYYGGVVGMSDDGSQVYYVGMGQIVAGAQNSDQFQLYRWDADHGVTHLTGLSGSGGETRMWDQGFETGQARESWTTPDGRFLLLRSLKQLDPDRDNGGYSAVYRYDADQNHFSCVSCPFDGSPATADATLGSEIPLRGAADGFVQNNYVARRLTDDGQQAFFTTTAALVPEDSNGQLDVYRWKAGVGLSLVSTGTSSDRAYFGDASPDGEDVFFVTRERLSGWDVDNNLDLYDARVNGGFPEPAASAPACSGDGCQPGEAAQPPMAAIGTVSFASPPPTGPAARTAPPARATVSKIRTVRGTSTRLRVKVPGKGRIRISGSGLRQAQRAAGQAGSYSVTVKLSERSQQTLKRRHRVKVRVTVRFTPEHGKAQSISVPVTFESTAAKATRRARPAASTRATAATEGGR